MLTLFGLSSRRLLTLNYEEIEIRIGILTWEASPRCTNIIQYSIFCLVECLASVALYKICYALLLSFTAQHPNTFLLECLRFFLYYWEGCMCVCWWQEGSLSALSQLIFMIFIFFPPAFIYSLKRLHMDCKEPTHQLYYGHAWNM